VGNANIDQPATGSHKPKTNQTLIQTDQGDKRIRGQHPTIDIVNATLFCGRKSGKSHAKFKETKLTPMPARNVKSPIINECVAHLECKLHSQHRTGDHAIIVGRVIQAYANKEAFTETYNLRKAKLIFHSGADEFAVLNPKIYRPKL